jgi:hypothetical protein
MAGAATRNDRREVHPAKQALLGRVDVLEPSLDEGLQAAESESQSAVVDAEAQRAFRGRSAFVVTLSVRLKPSPACFDATRGIVVAWTSSRPRLASLVIW